MNYGHIRAVWKNYSENTNQEHKIHVTLLGVEQM